MERLSRIRMINKYIAQRILTDVFQLPSILYNYLIMEIRSFMQYEKEDILLIASDYKM